MPAAARCWVSSAVRTAGAASGHRTGTSQQGPSWLQPFYGFTCVYSSTDWHALQVNTCGTLDPATHAYSFWEGVPTKCRCAFGELVARSTTVRCIAVVQRSVRRRKPEELLAAYGFGALQLVETVSGVHMSGTSCCSLLFFFASCASAGWIRCRIRMQSCCFEGIILLMHLIRTHAGCVHSALHPDLSCLTASTTCTGSQRSFSAYIFERVIPGNANNSGPKCDLLSSYLAGPRSFQATLPRTLRSHSRRTKAASAASLNKGRETLVAQEAVPLPSSSDLQSGAKEPIQDMSKEEAAEAHSTADQQGSHAINGALPQEVAQIPVSRAFEGPRLVSHQGRLVVKNPPLQSSFGLGGRPAKLAAAAKKAASSVPLGNGAA
jgi:hypothetical protein